MCVSQGGEGGREGRLCGEVVVFEAGRGAQTKPLASLISCLAFSAPVGGHMLTTGPRGCLP